MNHNLNLYSYYDRNKAIKEVKRVLKPGGLFLVLGRGISKISLYNEYLQFKAGEDIKTEGCVYNLDFEQIFKDDPDFEIEHFERLNLGMTFVMMMRKKGHTEVIKQAE